MAIVGATIGNTPRGDIRDAFATEKLTVPVGAVSLTAATYNTDQPAQAALVTVETNIVVVRFDGTAPTDAVGHQLAVGDKLFLMGANNIRNFKAIRNAVADGAVQVTYFR